MSTEHFVTLFDGNYLPQGLALYESLERHGGDFVLWVLCLDDQTKTVLDRIAHPRLRTVALAEVETPALLAVKPGRTRAEYCWTLTPFTPKVVFDREPTAQRATYVDADVWLLRSPQPVLAELEASGRAVQITEHAYDAAYDQTAVSGRYCVQFMTFVRDASEPVRQWWEDRCVEWCFATPADGKLGDQKYLDDWTERFPDDVHVLSDRSAFLAPWNARRFPHSEGVAWHFHGLRLTEDGHVRRYRDYQIPACVDDAIYDPYVASLRRQLALIGEPVVRLKRDGRLTEALRAGRSLASDVRRAVRRALRER